MVYPTEHRYPIHRDCSNFVNDICRLNGAPVDPNGPACPRFTPKSTTKTIQAEADYPRARRSYQMHPMRGQGQPLGRRGGRGWGMGNSVGRTRDVMAYPYRPPMHPQTPSTTVRAQEKEALTQQLEELENQLNEVRRKMEKLRTRQR
jgi:hypothetical protein